MKKLPPPLLLRLPPLLPLPLWSQTPTRSGTLVSPSRTQSHGNPSRARSPTAAAALAAICVVLKLDRGRLPEQYQDLEFALFLVSDCLVLEDLLPKSWGSSPLRWQSSRPPSRCCSPSWCSPSSPFPPSPLHLVSFSSSFSSLSLVL